MERDTKNLAKSPAFETELSTTTKGLNYPLVLTERQLLGNGLPNRPRHILQAPGYFLGCGSQAVPGIAETFRIARPFSLCCMILRLLVVFKK